jgi:hypothetical protein
MSNQKQQLVTDTFKRFDDIFRMFLILVTIMMSIGSISNSSGVQINLWSGFGFIILSLIFWMLGHAIGEGDYRQLTVLLKSYAWISVCMVAIVTFFKFWYNLSTLTYSTVILSAIFAIVATVLPFSWLSIKTLNESVIKSTAAYLFIGFAGLFFGWAVTGNLTM